MTELLPYDLTNIPVRPKGISSNVIMVIATIIITTIIIIIIIIIMTTISIVSL